MSEHIEEPNMQMHNDEDPKGTNVPSDEGDIVDAEEPISQSSNDDSPETFTREYVQNLRDESAKYRTRAKDRDAVAERLHSALVAATGRLADPSDLPFDDGHLTDAETLTAAIDDLLATKPHLASRKPSGNIGQGTTAGSESVDLAGMLRARAS